MNLTDGSQMPAASIRSRLGASVQAAQHAPRAAVIAVQVILALGILLALWRYALAEHDDVGSYLLGARYLVSDGRPYYALMYWKEIGYWTGDLRDQPYGHGPYLYPPPIAILMVPLLTLPEWVASLIWYVVAALATVLSSFVLARLLIGRSLLAFLVVTTLVVYFQPIRRNLSLGQADTVTLGFVTLALAAFIARRDTRVALALAGAISIKPFVGFVVLFLIWKRAYRAAFITVLAAGALVGGSLVLIGPQTVRDYVEGMSYWTSPQSASSVINQAASGMLLRAFTSLNGPARIAEAPWLVVPLRIVITLLTVGVLAGTVSRERTLPTPTLATEFGLVLVAMIFISPLGEDLHLVYAAIMLLGGALLVYRAQPLDRALLLTGAALAGFALVYLFPMHRLIVWDAPFYELCTTLLIGTLLLAADARRRRLRAAEKLA